MVMKRPKILEERSTFIRSYRSINAIAFIIFFISLISGQHAVEDCSERNVTIARENGQVCQNPCKARSDCRSKSRQCVCDGFCGASCIRTFLRCPKLNNPDFGVVQLNPDDKINATAKYSCAEGYIILGPIFRSCRGEGKWDKSQPACLKVEQTAPVFKPTTAPTTELTTINFSFRDILSTNSLSFVGVGGDDNFQIIPDEIEPTRRLNDMEKNLKITAGCQNPPHVAYSIQVDKQVVFAVGSEIEYKCNYGFFAVSTNGDKERITMSSRCEVNSTVGNVYFWTPLNLECRKKTCPDPGQILHGERDGHLSSVGSEVKYECDEGYHMVGRPMILCTPSGTWSRQTPSCLVNQCETPEIPSNGNVQYESVDFRSKAAYSCQEPFVMIGRKIRECLIDGTWSGQSPSCQVAHCKPPLFLPYGEIIIGDGPIVSGYSINFKCDGGGILSGLSSATCLDNGDWSNRLPECKTTCHSSRVANGILSLNDNAEIGSEDVKANHGQTVRLLCNDGFQVFRTTQQTVTVECNDGRWVPNLECTPAGCSLDDANSFKPIGSRSINFQYNTKFEHNDKIYVSCRYKYIPQDEREMACKFGKWAWIGETPFTCTPKPCKVGGRNIGDSSYKNTRIGELISHGTFTLECSGENDIFKDHENGRVECNFGSFTEETFPQCVPQTCSPLEIENGENIGESENRARVDVRCDADYASKDDVEHVVCEYGSWRPDNPSCIKAKIEVPTTEESFFVHPKFCTYDPGEHRFVFTDLWGGRDISQPMRVFQGTVVKSRCKDRTNFVVDNGSVTANCLNGEWIPAEPLTCRRSKRNDMIVPFFAKKTRWNLVSMWGGFYLAVDNIIFVKEWTELHLQCRVIGRSAMAEWRNEDNVRMPTYRDGGYIVYKITYASYKHAGRYTCYIDDKTEHTVVEVVKEFGCPRYVPWQNYGLKVKFNEYDVGSEAEFSCKPGYIFQGSNFATCNKKYIWQSDDTPLCVQETGCDTPSIGPDSKLMFNLSEGKYEVGEIIQFSCRSGYIISEDYQTLRCLPTGWNHEVPSCIRGCVFPSLQNEPALQYFPRQTVYLLGDRVTFSCKAGYRIKEQLSLIFCRSRGWYGQIPTCVLDTET